MKLRLSVMTVAVVSALSANAALADIFTANSSIAPGQVGADGGPTTYSGVFNFSSTLGAGGYQLQSATMSFAFHASGNALAYSSSSYNGSSSSGYYYNGGNYDGSNYHNYYYQNTTQYFTTNQATYVPAASVISGVSTDTLGAAQASTNSSTGISSNSRGASGYTTGNNGYTSSYSYCCGFSTCTGSQWNPGTFNHYTTYYYDQTITNTTYAYGSFGITVNLDLNGVDFSTLAGSYVLPFTLNVQNKAYLDSATLSVVAAPVVTAPVPEPETYALMLAGLGLLGFMNRRRKQKQA